MRRLARLISGTPFTVGLVVVLTLVAVATGPFSGPSTLLRDVVGIDLGSVARAEWWSFLTADFFVDNLGQLLLVLAVAIICVGSAERLIGTVRTMLAFVVTGALSFAVGLLIQGIGVAVDEFWAQSVRGTVMVDPLAAIIGTLAVASAWASTLWRRRIRTMILASTLVFLLFSGHPSDLNRAIAVVIGILLGSLFVRGRGSRAGVARSSAREMRVLLASVTAAFSVGPLVTLLSQGRLGLLSPLGMFVTDALPRDEVRGNCSPWSADQSCVSALGHLASPGISALVLAIVPLLLLLVGARGLLQGRRAAVYLVAGITAGDGVLAAFYFGVVPVLGQSSHLATRAGHAVEFGAWMIADVVLPLLFAALLVASRRFFPIRAERPARRRFVATALGAFIGLSGLYVTVASLAGAQFRPIVSVLDLIADLPERFIPVSFLVAEHRDFVPVGPIARVASAGVGPLFWLILLVAAVILLRSAPQFAVTREDSALVRTLLRRGAGTMSFPMTWVGNSFWIDEDRRTVIAYRVANGCAVTLGDPVGDPLDRRATLARFLAFCDENALRPVFYSIHVQWATLLRTLGWSTATVAEETVIDVQEWTLSGKKVQDIRSSVNRAAREGLGVEWSSWADLPLRTTLQIIEISEAWAVDKSLPEMGFTLGGVDELRDRDVLLGVVHDSTGAVQAVTSWMPSWRDGLLVGYTLDFMRRRTDSMNGVMEYLIAEAALRAQAEGLEFLSLSGAPLAVSHGDDDVHAPLDRVLVGLRVALEPVYGFSSLLAFKKKFRPRLVPLSLAYADALSLPTIGLALSRCYLPEFGLRDSARLARLLRRPHSGAQQKANSRATAPVE